MPVAVPVRKRVPRGRQRIPATCVRKAACYGPSERGGCVEWIEIDVVEGESVNQCVGTEAADERVGEGIRVVGREHGRFDQKVAVVAAVESVRAIPAVELVVVVAAEELVVAVLSEHQVVSGVAVEGVGLALPNE